MTLEKIKKNPIGFSLSGSPPNYQGNNITELTEKLQKNLNNIHSIAYLNQQNEYSYLPIKDFQIISSLERKIVLVFSVDKLDLPLDLTPGKIIYSSLEQLFNSHSSTSLLFPS